MCRAIYQLWRTDQRFAQCSLLMQHALTTQMLRQRFGCCGRVDIRHWSACTQTVDHYLSHALRDNGHAAHDDCFEASGRRSLIFKNTLKLIRVLYHCVALEWQCARLIAEYAADGSSAPAKDAKELSETLQVYGPEPLVASLEDFREAMCILHSGSARTDDQRMMTFFESLPWSILDVVTTMVVTG